jgi:hypothetical protein
MQFERLPQELCPLHQLLDDAARQFEEALARTKISDLLPKRARKHATFPKSAREDSGLPSRENLATGPDGCDARWRRDHWRQRGDADGE